MFATECKDEIPPYPPLYSNIRTLNHCTPNTVMLVRGITDSGVSGRHGDGGDRQVDDVNRPGSSIHTAPVLHRVDGDAL